MTNNLSNEETNAGTSGAESSHQPVAVVSPAVAGSGLAREPRPADAVPANSLLKQAPNSSNRFVFTVDEGSLYQALVASRISGTGDYVHLRVGEAGVAIVSRNERVVFEADLPVVFKERPSGTCVWQADAELFNRNLVNMRVTSTRLSRKSNPGLVVRFTCDGTELVSAEKPEVRLSRWTIDTSGFSIIWPFLPVHDWPPPLSVAGGEPMRSDRLREVLGLVSPFAERRGRDEGSSLRNVDLPGDQARAGASQPGWVRHAKGVPFANFPLRLAGATGSDLAHILSHCDPNVMTSCADGWRIFYNDQVRCAVRLEAQEPRVGEEPERVVSATLGTREFLDRVVKIRSQASDEDATIDLVLDGGEDGILTLRTSVPGGHAHISCPARRHHDASTLSPTRHEIALSARSLLRCSAFARVDEITLDILKGGVCFSQVQDGLTVRTLLRVRRGVTGSTKS